MGKLQAHSRYHKREPRGQPFPEYIVRYIFNVMLNIHQLQHPFIF